MSSFKVNGYYYNSNYIAVMKLCKSKWINSDHTELTHLDSILLDILNVKLKPVIQKLKISKIIIWLC